MDEQQINIFDQMTSNPKFWSGVDFYRERFSEIPKGKDRAHSIQQFVDKALKKEVYSHPLVKDRIACKKGCNHCCYLMVSVTDDEADLLVEWCGHKKIPIDTERLRKQSMVPVKDGKDYIKKVSYEDRKCVFLSDEGVCKVYEHRPITCRSYLVADSSEGCDTRGGSMMALTLTDENQTQVQTAAGIVGGMGIMAEQLLKKL